MFHRCLFLLLFSMNLFIGSNADDVDPLIQKCVIGVSDSTASFTKIVSNDECRQPFEVLFALEGGSNYYVNTENILPPLDNSEISYSFESCKLRLKAHNNNGEIWFELLELGEQSMSGQRIEPSFIIKFEHHTIVKDTIELISKSYSTSYTSAQGCKFAKGLGDGKKMTFKQEVQSGDPNIELALYKTGSKTEGKYFGEVSIKSGSTFGSLPAFPTTTSLPTTKSDILSTINPSSSISTSSAKSTVSAQSTSTQFNSTTLQSTAAPVEDKQEEDQESLIGMIVFVAIASVAILILSSLSLCSLNLRRKCCKKKGMTGTYAATTQETTQTQERMTY